jgi:ribokinase
MPILNFGSINIDHVFFLDHMVRPGETLASREVRQFAGGKGFNQSMALAHAGAAVFHAGKVGPDGLWLVDRLKENGVDTTLIQTVNTLTGQAIIQVDREGENAIILFGGANREITDADVHKALSGFKPGDYLLLQNEISSIPEIIRLAEKRGMGIIMNPAPFGPEILRYPLELVDLFILNEIEGRELTGEREFERICRAMVRKFPQAVTVLTVGDQGAWMADTKRMFRVEAEKVKAVDTTAAGDTFVGYFVNEYIRGNDPALALRMACRAATICVTRPGAADSIPKRGEVAGS